MESKDMSVDKWIKKICYMLIMDYHSALKKKEIMPYVTIWVKLDIMPSNKPVIKYITT